jgi:hypothetical protein
VDVDLDGDLDLFSGSAYYSENLNQGAGWTVVTQAPCDYQGVSGYGIADIDGDGDPDVVSTASVFVNTTRDLSSSPWARPGRSTVLSVYGNAGDAWWLGGSLGVYATPLPPYGRLFLDPTQMFFLATDSIGPTGVGTVSFSIPDPTPLLGTTTFWQALVQGANSVGLTRLHQTTIEQL